MLGTQQIVGLISTTSCCRCVRLAKTFESHTSVSLVAMIFNQPERMSKEARITKSCLPSKADHKRSSTNLARPFACRNVVGLHRCLQNCLRDLRGSRQLSRQWTDFTFQNVNLSCRERNSYVAKLDPRTAKRNFRLSIGCVPLCLPQYYRVQTAEWLCPTHGPSCLSSGPVREAEWTSITGSDVHKRPVIRGLLTGLHFCPSADVGVH